MEPTTIPQEFTTEYLLEYAKHGYARRFELKKEDFEAVPQLRGLITSKILADIQVAHLKHTIKNLQTALLNSSVKSERTQR